MAEVTRKTERKNPVHRAVCLLLGHLAVQQPEAAAEAKELTGHLDELFAKEADWEALIEEQKQRGVNATPQPEPPAEPKQGA